jgi:serine/threonine protein kinase
MMPGRTANAAWLAPGCRLDRYDLLFQVAEGGMGSLWLARQHGKHGFDRIVAIKTILPKLASDPGFQQMFLDEARVVSRIEHPNVAQVLDLGEERGVLFLVMEWIDGESLVKLGRVVARETSATIPVGILARIMVDACAGLHAAHELTDDEGLPLGVVHRDVSPHNLLVGFRGTTKVIDFGIAKARNRIAQDTSVGSLKGKLAYMAPEQAMGLGVDRRTDIWSTGATIYSFLAGRSPYNASEPVAVFRRIAAGLPPAPLPRSVPEPFRLVVERALELDVSKRFETAHEMGAALERAMRDANAYTTREDVAAFLTDRLGEVRAIRTREIEHAVRESRARMRVEMARTESSSMPVMPAVHDARVAGLAPIATESFDVPFLGARAAGEPARPSDQPTAIGPGMPMPAGGTRGGDAGFRPSLHPTVILGRPPPEDVAGDLPRPVLSESTDSARLVAGLPVTPPAAFVSRLRRQASGSLLRRIVGACLLVALLAVGFAWRATSRSRPGLAQGVAASSEPPREPVAIPTVPPSAPAVQATAPEPEPAAPSAVEGAASAADLPAVAPVPGALPRAHGSADTLLERARRARRAGRIGDAAALFAAAVEEAPTDSEALTGLAETDDAQGATVKAIAVYRRALAFNQGYLPARLGLADSLWTNGQRDEARAAYRSIVDHFPRALCPDVARERAGGADGIGTTPK